MAESAVSFLIEKIESILSKEWGLPEKINAGISSLRTELETIQALLKDADANAKSELEHQVTDWLAQVRDLAYSIEDVLDTCTFHKTQRDASHLYYFSQFKDRHFIDDLIDRINSRLKKISEKREWYVNRISSSVSSSSRTNYTNLHQRIAPLFMEDADVVGIEGTTAALTCWALQGRDSTYKAMFVVGLGGSGKTTLVKKVYERVKGGFDCHAWIIASKSKTKLELLRTMFGQLSSSQDMFIHQDQVGLMQKMRDHLQDKGYLIVLNDLWVKDVWESINCALPRRGNRGRIIITTRRGDIAYSCTDNSVNVHEVQPLPLEMAQQLFYKKAFPPNGCCPSHLVGCSQNILKKCEGLPLGIIEIGQFLSHRESSESEWQKFHDSLKSELKRSGRLSNTMNVLSISYNDLPYHLKYCFLYLSIFPDSYLVKRRRLIRLWIAEGFIKKETGKELEDVGEEYLKELIERSLVQASELDFDGNPRMCRVHNLLHKIILSKSQEENFCTVCTELAGRSNLYENTRRLSLQNSTTRFKLAQQNLTCCRTLFVFGKEGPDKLINSSNLKLLKVVHLEGASFDEFPNEIVELLLLRYLCLSNTRISSIPKSIEKLRYLETLDLKQTLVTKLPKKVTNLKNLRHLLVCHYNIGSYVSFDSVKGFSISSKVGELENLQKLSFVKANRHHGMIQALENLTQLRKLGIIDLPQGNGPSLCSTIQKLRKLQSLNVTSSYKEECIDLKNISDPPLLRRLYLKGRLEMLPGWISKLNDLVRIRLKWSRLGDNHNPIELLQDLPNLLELQLLDEHSWSSVMENFRSLKY